MLTIRFAGWVSCRLATDPDPYDDPRGTLSGFQQLAYSGEPDLDRVIRFQRPPYVRSHTWPIGVTVREVIDGIEPRPAHPLLGAEVDLLDGAVFEGRNDVIASDTREPIFPFHLQISAGDISVSRAVVPSDPDYPFPEFLPVAEPIEPDVIFAAAGVTGLTGKWQDRLSKLRTEHAAASEHDRPGLEERMAMLSSNLSVDQGGVARFFLANMHWRYSLRSAATFRPSAADFEAAFGVVFSDGQAWTVDFWFGGFDADAQAFFCAGSLAVPQPGEQRIVSSLARARSRVMAR